MSTLPRVLGTPELLDAPRHDDAELQQSLDHVAAVNRWLGGDRSVLRHLMPVLQAGMSTRILDVATGSALLPLRIARWARKRNCPVRIVATDVHPQMLQIATANARDYPEITVQRADALRLPFAAKSFDVVLLTLALHHFEDADAPRVLAELVRVARRRVIVSDLRRTRLNYLGAKLLSWTYWRGNRLTRHDGPLSVLRAFTIRELAELAGRTGRRIHIHRHFFQRAVLVIDLDAGPADV